MVSLGEGVLWLHIAAGFLALFGGAGALLTRKGGTKHRRAGRVYVGSMTFVSASALVLFALDPTPTRQFLALVAVFSFYFVLSGYRVLSRKRPADRPGTLDWIAAGLMALSGVGLVAFGANLLLTGDSFGTVMAVFGAIALGFGANDLRTFRTPPSDRRAWFFEHLTRMGAGYIATVTAFSSVNVLFLPPVVRWLLPTALGTPAIALAVRKYQS